MSENKNYEFKFLPRYANNDAKHLNITKFLESLDVSTRSTPKGDKPANYEEYYLFNSLYNSTNEIMRNRDALNDRDVRASVHTIVASSKSSNDLAFIAGNIDGMMDSLKSKITAFGAEGDFKQLQATAKAWEAADKEVSALVEKLKKIVDDNLKEGYGSTSQLRKHEFTKFENSIPEVEKLLDEGKNSQEIATALDVRAGYVEKHSSQLIDKKLNTNIALIKSKLSESTNRQEIADELKVPKGRLNKFITERKLMPKPVEKKPTAKKNDKQKNNKTEAKTSEKTTAPKEKKAKAVVAPVTSETKETVKN